MRALPIEGMGEETRARCQNAFDSDVLRAVAQLAGDTAGLVEQVKYAGPLPAPWVAMTGRATDAGIPDPALNVARYLLLDKILSYSLDHVSASPLPPDVQYFLLDDYRFVAEPERISLDCLEPGSYPLAMLCRETCLKRFPVGQLHVDESGFPRGWLRRIPPLELLPVAWHVFVRMGGRQPYYVPHNAHRKKFSTMFLEKEQRRSMIRIAQLLESNPHVRGFMGVGWLHSPNLGEASPHLKWMMEINRELVALGAAFTTLGPLPDDAGFLTGDKRRIAMYQAGQWKPLDGLLLAPRDVLIEWSRRQTIDNIRVA